MAAEQPKQPLTFLVTGAGPVEASTEVDARQWQYASEEERDHLLGLIRAELVKRAAQNHPDCLFAFTPPKIEQGGFTVMEGHMVGKAVKVTCQAMVFEPNADYDVSLSEGCLRIGDLHIHKHPQTDDSEDVSDPAHTGEWAVTRGTQTVYQAPSPEHDPGCHNECKAPKAPAN